MSQGYASSTVIRLVAIALNAMGALLLLPFILKSLGEYEFGIWSMAASITGYLLLLDFGVAQACTRYLSIHGDEPARWRRTVSSAMLLSLGLMLLLLVGAVVAQLLLHSGKLADEHQLLVDVVTLLLAEVAFSIPLRLYQSILRARVRYLDIGWFEIIRIVLRLGGIPLILQSGGGLLDIVFYSSFVNVLFFALMLASVYLREHTLYFHWRDSDRQHLQELFGFSKFVAISQVAEFFRYRTDNLLVGALLGVGAVAPYAIMIVLVDMFTQILMRFQGYWDTVIMREIGKGEWQAAWTTMMKSLRIGVSLTLLVVTGTWLLSEWVLTLWVGEQYAYVAPTLTLFTATLAGTAIQLATSPYLNALGWQRMNAWLGVLEVVCKLVLVWILAHWYGFKGVVYASLLASVLLSALRLSVVSRTRKQAFLAIKAA